MANYMPALALRKLNTGGVVVGTDSFKVSLNTGTVPTANRDSANQYYGGSDFTEATGTNYTATGTAITLSESLQSSYHGSAVACASPYNVSWSNVTLSSVTYAVLYDSTQASKVALAVYDFGGAQSVTANTFQINFTDSTPSGRVWYLSAS